MCGVGSGRTNLRLPGKLHVVFCAEQRADHGPRHDAEAVECPACSRTAMRATIKHHMHTPRGLGSDGAMNAVDSGAMSARTGGSGFGVAILLSVDLGHAVGDVAVHLRSPRADQSAPCDTAEQGARPVQAVSGSLGQCRGSLTRATSSVQFSCGAWSAVDVKYAHDASVYGAVGLPAAQCHAA